MQPTLSDIRKMAAEAVESAMNTSDEKIDKETSETVEQGQETEIVTLDKMKRVNLTVVARDVMKSVVRKVIN